MIANTLCTHVVGLFRHCVYGNRLPGKFVVPDLRTVWWIHASEVGVSTHQCSIIVRTSYMYLNNQPQSAMCRTVIRQQMCSLINAANNITCVESIHRRDDLQLIEEFKNAQATTQVWCAVYFRSEFVENCNHSHFSKYTTLLNSETDVSILIQTFLAAILYIQNGHNKYIWGDLPINTILCCLH